MGYEALGQWYKFAPGIIVSSNYLIANIPSFTSVSNELQFS